MATRRSFLALLAASIAALRPSAWAQPGIFARRPKQHAAAAGALVFFGTQTTARGGSKGIYSARFDLAKGQFTAPVLAAACVGPTFLAAGQNSTRHLLYAVNEGDAQRSGVTSFAVDPVSGSLRPLNQVSSGGTGPCYVAVAAAGRSAYVANYVGGTVTSFAVRLDGTLSAPFECVDLRKLHKPGPQADRQESAHPHSAALSPDNKFLLVCDLGSDVIYVFPVDAATGHLGKPTVNEVRMAGAGPRHTVFHPNGRWVYGLDELTNRLDQYLWNTVHAAGGQPEQALLTDAGHSVSTLAPSYSGPKNTAAELAIAPSGRFLYASNRGEDSLVVFAVEDTTGALTLVQRIACGGQSPRHFTLNPAGNWLVCSNQVSGTVTVFRRDESSGRLSGPVQTIAVPEALFALFV